jgi:biotin carboxyl carrier protein
VGIYHIGKKGKEIMLKENVPVKKDAFLGSIEMNNTQTDIIAPCGGILRIIAVSDGQSAEYGQPLFFIESE